MTSTLWGIRYLGRRNRIGPLAVEGSTTLPPCVICSSPRATMRRAARRAGSMSSCQLSPPIALAASEGQMVASFARWPRSVTMVSSSLRSVASTPCRRQASEQYLTDSQSRAHFARHSMRRPQEAHDLSAGGVDAAERDLCAISPVCTKKARRGQRRAFLANRLVVERDVLHVQTQGGSDL